MELTPQRVGEITTVWARRDPDRVALRDPEGRELSYGRLEARANRLAHGLRALGLQTGDRVATWMTDGFAYVEIYLAIAKAGLVACPVNDRHTAAEAAYVLEDSGARVLVHADVVDAKVAELPSELLAGLQVFRATPFTDWEELVAHGPSASEPPEVELGRESPVVIGYTSGTTGRPKGAILTHRSVLEIGRINATSYRLSAYPRTALTGSMSFVSVVPAHVLCTLRLGGTLTIMGAWGVDDLLAVLERDLITFIYVSSPRIEEVANALERSPESWQNLRSVMHSASRARPDQLSLLTRVVGARVVEGWGMTENSGGLMTATLGHEMLGAKDDDDWSYATAGLPALDTEVRVLGEDGEEVPHDGETIGELWFRSPGMFVGYWNRPEATEAALVDGWFRTGDLGAIDQHGYVFVSERRTDLIVSGGANVYPSEVEDCIASVPGVVDVAVVGAEHERWGQTVVAVVVRQGPDFPSEEQVLARCRDRLAGYKKPTRVHFVDSLPRTPSQKVSRAAVREMVKEW
jgi:acyl-CoA synthetase (AMP-forming)/AMP-acid ligase II